MTGVRCPATAELLAWLHDSAAGTQPDGLAAHIDSCLSCQAALEQLSQDEDSQPSIGAAGLMSDLRCSPPLDVLETEYDKARASARDEGPSCLRPSAEPLSHQGHYRVLAELGRGGMGVVYKARDEKLDRLVALKVLPARSREDAGAIARFERERKTVARLTHPNIVAAYEANEIDGVYFLVMEYVDGVDLKSLVKASGPLAVGRAIDCIVQAARGLHSAHEMGVVHRDVKPANLMLAQGGGVKVLDLGLARIESGDDLTETGTVMGTLDYLAPEQAENSKHTDRRADIYGLGCTLYYLLTGRPLYEADTAIKKVMAHREQPIPRLRSACPTAPKFVEKVFAKMVAKRPEDRQQTMLEVIAELERKPSVAKPGPRKSRRLWCLAVVALLAGIVGTGVLCWSKRPLVPLTVGAEAGEEWDGNELEMKFCWCPPGRFTMGSPPNEPGRAWFESAPKEVVLTQGYWLGKFEVTQGEWERMMGSKPSRFQGSPKLPVENVSWAEAVRFCDALTKRERARGSISEGWRCRLPTEAQWERACRAGTTTAYSFGDSPKDIGDHAWYGHNAQMHSHEVGLKKANAWGLHDMHGNVWEWCEDWYDKQLPGGTDPEITTESHARVMRGSGWSSVAELCRTAFRTGEEPGKSSHLLGFRVAIVQVAAP